MSDKTFIEKVAIHIHDQEIDLSHLTIVLPSERAKKYLHSALFETYNKPIIAPNIITMDKWVKSYSPETVIDKTRALIQLYYIHEKSEFKQSTPDKESVNITFDEFLKWGSILLSDFNEIDRYLLDAKQVFRNLADIKEIEQWSFNDETKLTETQKKFMEFWDRLPGYYYELNKVLSKEGSCYAGKSFKFLTENISSLFKEDKDATFIFAGFNALSKAELSIIRQLEAMGRAEIFIDADEYYLANKSHEAGSFLRELSSFLDDKKLNFVDDKLRTKNMEVEIVECAQKTGQVKAASTILESLTAEQIDDTLLLLADESLIGSILKNLPKSIGKANITLGLPIRNTALRTWVELIFSIQENKKRFKTKSLYFNDLKDFGNHPFLLGIIDDEEKKQLIDAEKQIVRYNKIFLNPENIKIGAKSKELLLLLTSDWCNGEYLDCDWNKSISLIRKMNKLIYRNLDAAFSFEKAVLEGFDKSLVDYENILKEGVPTMNLKSFEHLFNQHWGMKSIAYHGNPLKGLQIMGLLETRALDFKRIICVGMNEGQLPPTNPIQTMIPMDLRGFLGLPTPRDKQGLFAHHFYRLLHGCEDLTVTYTSADESIGSNEPSRYLMQLEMELSRRNENIHLKRSVYSLKSENQSSIKQVEKTVEIMNRMDELFENSTSASMLKTYIACPLDFYFKYIMEFGDEDAVEEEIESNTFGTFIHNTLEILYTPFTRFDVNGKENVPAPTNITSYDVEKMLKEYEVVMHKQFMEHFNNDRESFMKGKNLLSYKMAMELTKRFLKSEIDFLAQQTELVFIESLESSYEKLTEIEVNGSIKKVKLRGFIDRIDRVGDKVRIIDYKSGKVADSDVRFGAQFKGIESTEEKIVHSIKGNKHLLQLIQYAYLYYQKHGEMAESSIVSFISGNFEPFTLDGKSFDLDDIIMNYPKYLGMILSEMYDDETPFKHTEAYFSYCQYCG